MTHVDFWTPAAILIGALLCAGGLRVVERVAHMRAARRTRDAIDRVLAE